MSLDLTTTTSKKCFIINPMCPTVLHSSLQQSTTQHKLLTRLFRGVLVFFPQKLEANVKNMIETTQRLNINSDLYRRQGP